MKRTFFLILAVVLALAMLIPLTTVVMAASVVPTDVSALGPGNSGNASPDDVGYSSPTYFNIKVDGVNDNPPVSGSYNDGTYSVDWTISADGKSLSFSNASPGIAAVIVKGGNGAFLYEYDPAATSDTLLVSPLNGGGNIPGISHFYLIWQVPPVPPVPELPAGLLFGLGLAGVGGFIFIKRKHLGRSQS